MVSDFSRTQKCVTLSKTGAKYVALFDVLREALLFTQVCRFMWPQAGMHCVPLRETQKPVPTRTTPIPGTILLGDSQKGKNMSDIPTSSENERADFLTKGLTAAVESFELHCKF